MTHHARADASAPSAGTDTHTAATEENAAPSVFASLREFSHAPRGPWQPGGAPVDLAEEFHLASKVCAAFSGQAMGPAGRHLATSAEAPFRLGRKSLAHAGPCIHLPRPPSLPIDLSEVVRRRRSGLPERAEPLGLATLGTVLGLSAAQADDRPGFRVVPSAGAMYPLDVFVVAHSVSGLAPGSYLYDPIAHALRPRAGADPVEFHARAGGDVLAPPQPAATLALVATFARTRAKYGLRGYRFALLEAGHLAQAVIVAATALGLRSLPWGGFVDAAVDELLDLDGLERSCVYLVGLAGPDDAPGGGGADAGDR